MTLQWEFKGDAELYVLTYLQVKSNGHVYSMWESITEKYRDLVQEWPGNWKAHDLECRDVKLVVVDLTCRVYYNKHQIKDWSDLEGHAATIIKELCMAGHRSLIFHEGQHAMYDLLKTWYEQIYLKE